MFQVQLSVLRALHPILSHNHFLEPLLVPRSHLKQGKQVETNLLPALTQQADLQQAIRIAMKRPVQRMPISRALTLSELERTIVYKFFFYKIQL